MKREVMILTDYNVAILECRPDEPRVLISMTVENEEYVTHLNPTRPDMDRVIRVWRVGDMESEAVYRARGWLP